MVKEKATRRAPTAEPELKAPRALMERLSPEDRARLEAWNDTRQDFDLESTLYDLIRRQAERMPDLVAVASPESGVTPSMTYRELNHRSDALAARLQGLGVGRDVPVSVSMDRSAELVVALLGVLKAGGAYVPVDPWYPAERRAFMLSDSAAPVVLTQKDLKPNLPNCAATVLAVDSIWPELTSGEPAPRATPDSLAYIIYTSGSTGRPKGAMIEHRSIVNRLLWTQQHFGLGDEDVVLQKTPYSFDVSVWELFWPLLVGSRLVMARPGGHTDSSYLAELVERAGVTTMHFVPSMLEMFLEVEGIQSRCGSLRNVICSGEALSPAVVNRFHQVMDERVELWNLYGPTEAAVDVTWWHCARGREDASVPIGCPLANTQIHVVDEEGRLAPVGEVGELLIGGVQVGRGYWQREDLTSERFVPDPFQDTPGARLYRTGDLARWRDDGVVEFLGRRDHQVKLRGQRIELGEIETILRADSSVKQATVIVREDRPGDRRLVAYIVPREADLFSQESARSALAAELPEVMVPAQFVVLPEMPLTPNGKLDRAALPQPGRARPELGHPYVRPRSEVEEYLASVWSEILDVEKVGIDDPFFELGGTSLQAARFVNRLQQQLHEFIYVVSVFDSPTIRKYAEFLIRDYGHAMTRRFGLAVVESARAAWRGHRDAGGNPLDEDAVHRLEAAVPRFPVLPGRDTGTRNPPAMFVLSPPRSGTTLLRVMLAGHPALFAAAELQLLHFERLAQRREAFTGRHSAWLDGTIRAVMELRGSDARAAKDVMAEAESEDLPVSAFYGRLQEWAGGRMLVDKSPSYAMDSGALERAERDFERPLYVHLVRHPYAVTESIVSYHMDQILWLHEHPFDARQLGELVWLLSHRNIERFLHGIPEERQYHLSFEHLVQEPESAMRELCDRFGLPFDEGLVQPYDGLEHKMVDGVHRDSTPMGDTRLLERKAIDPAVADAWKGVLENDYLSDLTWSMAERLGYVRPGVAGHRTSEAAHRGALRKKALADRRRAQRGER